MHRNKPNIVLVGFMGSGKTSVGRLLATRLGLDFRDLDAEIASEAGCSIPELFRSVGEAEFRVLERSVVQRLAHQERVVLATGGGAVVDPDNLTTLRQKGVLVYLNFPFSVLWERIKGSQERPLVFQGEEALGRLYDARQASYTLADYTISPSAKATPEEIAQLIIQRLSPDQPSLMVQTRTSQYPFYLGDGFFPVEGCRDLPPAGKGLLVTDEKVGSLYRHAVLERLAQAGWDLVDVTFAQGEQTKCLQNAQRIWEAGFAHGMDRKGCIFALGGGVIGDLAGFAASTYMRGVNFIILPTTLLAMVDSSIGGKVGINHPRGKNLIGAFHHPRAVLASVDSLSSLDRRNLSAGWAEVIKSALIGDAPYYQYLVSQKPVLESRETQLEAVFRSAKVKAAIVAQDEHEQGVRKLLNLGHTLGHGLEQALGYGTLLHGEAVAIGLAFAAFIAQRLGVAKYPLTTELRTLLPSYRLPFQWPEEAGVQEVLEPMLLDKKNQAGGVTFLLPIAPGEIVEERLKVEEVHRLMLEFRGENR